jgi:hypothetical protein
MWICFTLLWRIPNPGDHYLNKLESKLYQIDWLIDYLLFYVPLKNISLMWRRHLYRWRAAKFRPMLGAQGLWAGWDLYRATHAVTRGLAFSSLIQRTAQFSRLLQHKRGCGGSFLTRIKIWALLAQWFLRRFWNDPTLFLHFYDYLSLEKNLALLLNNL